MLTDLAFLWNNREKPDAPGRTLAVWVKRILQSAALLRILLRSSCARLKGANIGKLVILGLSRLQGRLTNLEIGDHSVLGRCELVLHDKIKIGRCVVINDGATLLTASHSLSDPEWKQTSKPITINDYAWIATNALILPGVTIGKGAVVGAGSVVRQDVADFTVVVGNPAVLHNSVRTKNFTYSPVLFCAPFEAWVGRNIHNVIINQQ